MAPLQITVTPKSATPPPPAPADQTVAGNAAVQDLGDFAALVPNGAVPPPAASAPADLGDFANLVPKGPQVDRGTAALDAIKQGLTSGFSDELAGIQNAGTSGLPKSLAELVRVIPSPVPGVGMDAVIGAARLATENIFGSDRGLSSLITGDPTGPVTKAYQQGRDEVRARQKSGQQQFPYMYGGMEAAGALATLPFAPEIGAAKLLPAAAKAIPLVSRVANAAGTGALYGGAFGAGEGEGAQDTLTGAGTGLVTGGIGGAVAAPVAEGVARGVTALAKPFQGAFRPAEEAARRVSGSLPPGMTLNDAASVVEQGQQHGFPLALVDTGGESTRALARSAANTSAPGREALQEATGPRFQTQGERFNNQVRQIVGGDVDSTLTREELKREARKQNRRGYALTFLEHDRPLRSDKLDQLMGAEAVQGAMRRAVTSSKDESILMGFGAFNPGVKVTEDGRILFAKGKGGVPAYPNLQFWDAVKQELDDAASRAFRSGSDKEGARLAGFAKDLRDELDNLTTNSKTGRSSYKSTRQGAAAFFGADDALEAGEKFVQSTLKNTEAKSALLKMTPAERKLFADGFASQLMKMVREVPARDRSSLTTRAFLTTPAAKERIQIALGPDGARRLESTLRLETIMEQSRAAVSSNSTTVRQLIEAGTAGGVGYGLVTGDYNPKDLTMAFVTGALLRGGVKRINGNVARKVGELLASDDPQAIRDAAQMAVRNPGLLDTLRRTDALLANQAGMNAPALAAPVKAIEGPISSRADEKKKD